MLANRRYVGMQQLLSVDSADRPRRARRLAQIYRIRLNLHESKSSDRSPFIPQLVRYIVVDKMGKRSGRLLLIGIPAARTRVPRWVQSDNVVLVPAGRDTEM